MNPSSLCLIAALFLAQLIRDAHSLRCYDCIPVLQSGEDCGNVRSDQMQTCPDGPDAVCRVTAVSLPGANGVRTPTINRGCGSTKDYSGNQSGFLQTGLQRCTTTAEGQRVAKLCLCNYDGCNSQTMGQLSDNSMYGVSAASSFSPATLIVGFFSVIMLTLRKIVA